MAILLLIPVLDIAPWVRWWLLLAFRGKPHKEAGRWAQLSLLSADLWDHLSALQMWKAAHRSSAALLLLNVLISLTKKAAWKITAKGKRRGLRERSEKNRPGKLSESEQNIINTLMHSERAQKWIRFQSRVSHIRNRIWLGLERL